MENRLKPETTPTLKILQDANIRIMIITITTITIITITTHSDTLTIACGASTEHRLVSTLLEQVVADGRSSITLTMGSLEYYQAMIRSYHIAHPGHSNRCEEVIT